MELEKRLCIVSVETLQSLYEYGSDPVALYLFYYKQCKIQQTNQSRTLDSFILKQLGWGTRRLRIAKKVLTDKRLIEFIQEHKSDGDFGKSYVKLNYLRSEASTQRECQNASTLECVHAPQQINAGSELTINAGSVSKDTTIVVYGDTDLNDLQEFIQLEFRKNKIPYNPPKDERNFIKHMTSKKFIATSLEYNQEPRVFISRLLELYPKLKYIKSINSAKDLYQNRNEIITKAQQQLNTQKTVTQLY